jgi:YHS domain-containing protein
VKDPEKYIAARDVSVRCAVHPTRRARAVAELRAEVNHEIYYLHDRATLARFKSNPRRYCGLVTDPVSHQRFRPTARSPRVVHAGRPYYFIRQSTWRTFRAHPDSFATRKGA